MTGLAACGRDKVKQDPEDTGDMTPARIVYLKGKTRVAGK